MPNYQREARQAARRHGLDPGVFTRQIRQESGFNPNARSPAGALGIAQFMPATARGMGVNPLDPRDALDGAARLMAGYVHRYGNYRDALVAYNAGPGTVGHGLPQETQNYVATILHGSNPSAAPRHDSGGGDSGGLASRLQGSVTPGAVTGGGFDAGGGQDASGLLSALLDRRQSAPAVAAPEAPSSSSRYLRMAGTPSVPQVAAPSGGGGIDGLLAALSVQGQELPQTSVSGAQTNVTGSPGQPSSPRSSPGGAPAHKSRLLEMFYNGPGGINAKNGQPEPRGFVSGHTDHVHVAAGPKTVVALGNLAEQMGLHVGENPHFGGVDPVHVPDSYHYKGEAIDVSGAPRRMRAFNRRVARIYGLA